MNSVEKLIVILVIYAVGELMGSFFFAKLRKFLGSRTTDHDQKWRELVKGMFERIVLLTGLLQGFPQIIIAFGALKIGTRLKADTESQATPNDFFLIGNLMSLLIVLIDFALIHRSMA